MKVVAVLGVIFLAIYLIFTGFVGLTGVEVPHLVNVLLQLLAVASGVLFLVSVGKCYHCCDVCEKSDK